MRACMRWQLLIHRHPVDKLWTTTPTNPQAVNNLWTTRNLWTKLWTMWTNLRITCGQPVDKAVNEHMFVASEQALCAVIDNPQGVGYPYGRQGRARLRTAHSGACEHVHEHLYDEHTYDEHLFGQTPLLPVATRWPR